MTVNVPFRGSDVEVNVIMEYSPEINVMGMVEWDFVKPNDPQSTDEECDLIQEYLENLDLIEMDSHDPFLYD